MADEPPNARRVRLDREQRDERLKRLASGLSSVIPLGDDGAPMAAPVHSALPPVPFLRRRGASAGRLAGSSRFPPVLERPATRGH